MKYTYLSIGLCTCLVAILVSTGFFHPSDSNEIMVCTQEVKMCPDGSYVGRTGPMCEFSLCPKEATPVVLNVAATSTTTAKLNQKILIGSTAITPRTIVEDSRCPIDVQCIQAGTVRVNAAISMGGLEEIVLLTLQKPVAHMNKQIELVEVSPGTSADKPITETMYHFTFRVTENTKVKKGTLRGTVTIGPICPVEREDTPCLPTPEMYAARKVFVYAEDKKTHIATLVPDAGGKFSAELPAGDYFIDMKQGGGPGGISGLPSMVKIKEGIVTDIRVVVDTGIR